MDRDLSSPWFQLEDAIPSAYLAMGLRTEYKRGQTIYQQGSTSTMFYYLASGRVRVKMTSRDGTERALGVIEPHCLFGETAAIDNCAQFASAECLSRAVVYTLPFDRILHLFKDDSKIALYVLRGLSKKVRVLATQVSAMSFQNAKKRVIELLYRLTEIYGHESPKGTVVAVRVTHQELADLAGLNRVTVSRILIELEQQRLIQRRDGCLVITSALTHES